MSICSQINYEELYRRCYGLSPMKTEWISMSESRPTEADFVKDEWAVELRYGDGFRTTIYGIARWNFQGLPKECNWRKVRLCPPPVEKTADELEWNMCTSNGVGKFCSMKDAFLAGRITKERGIAAKIDAIAPQAIHSGRVDDEDKQAWFRYTYGVPLDDNNGIGFSYFRAGRHTKTEQIRRAVGLEP